MRQFLKLLLPLALLAAACNKEMPGQVGNNGMEEQEGKTCSVTLKFNVSGSPVTKALDSGVDNDNTIARLDIYCYSSENELPEHTTLTGDALAEGYSIEEIQYRTRDFWVFANLPDVVADWYASKTMYQLSGGKDTTFPLEILYTTPHRLIMAGYTEVRFTKDDTVTIDLYRYMARADIGQIEVNFDDVSWMSKDVYVKNIAFTNVFKGARLVKDMEMYPNDVMPYYIYGHAYEFDYPCLGGDEEGYEGFISVSYMTDTFTSGDGTGVLAGNWNKIYNDNTYKAKGVLNIDVTGILKDATVQEYDIANGEGQVCSSTNPSISHTLTVNKSFYLMPGHIYEQNDDTLISESSQQTKCTKLVIELSVDGVSYFYPIRCRNVQPNTVYQFGKITLKGMGSEYSNFYELINDYDVDFQMSVSPWTTKALGDMTEGYKPGHKEEIY